MYNKFYTVTVAVVLLSLTACAGGGGNIKKSDAIPAQRRQFGPVEQVNRVEASQASLFASNRYNGFFQDLRAQRVGDLVTINIVETSQASKNAATKTERASSINAGISNLLGYESRMQKSLLPGKYKLPDSFSPTTMFKASLENEFDGSGSTTRNESMTASITAVVVGTLPNGNLQIEGTRQIRVNNETQFIILSGLIRPQDISPDNTILSSYIADAKIEYTGSGPVSDKQRPGWLMRAVDAIWPF